MQTIESLKRKIDSVTDLESVVKTMKAMASVRIRQYEKAVDSLRQYTYNIEFAIQAVLMHRSGVVIDTSTKAGKYIGVVVFGSDQGMCGQLNDQVLGHFAKNRPDIGSASGNIRVVAVGDRMRRKLENAGQPVNTYIRVPNSVEGITPRVQEILSVVNIWENQGSPEQVLLYYSRRLEKAGFSPHLRRLLPLDREWVDSLRRKSWPDRSLPFYTMSFMPLFSSLIRQYLFAVLYQAFAESMASENQSRLQSMQQAEKNIRDELEELNMHYHRSRQMSLTEELLDIVSGFELLKKK